MTADPKKSPFLTLVEPWETLLWQGRIGFTFVSSPVTALAFWILAGYTFWTTWGSYSLNEFCPPSDTGRSCGRFYILIPPAVLLIAVAVCFDVIERLAIQSSKAQGQVLLTDRRLIRASTWPWFRTRVYDYRANPPKRGIGGVLRFGRLGSIVLSREDANQVLHLIASSREGRR